MTFTDNFKGCDTRTIADGAMIQCKINGIYYAATIHRDDDGGPPDQDDGFWPSQDPAAPGWIGNNPRRSFDDQMRDCKRVMSRYYAGKMVYCGVGITAMKGGVELLGKYNYALWCVSINWPRGDNRYLRTVANDLLREAQPAAEAKLVEVIAQMKKTLKALDEKSVRKYRDIAEYLETDSFRAQYKRVTPEPTDGQG